MTKSLEKQLIDKHNLKGKSFGKWTVLQYLKAGIYQCQCVCGHVGNKQTNELIMLRSTQCGNCRRKEMRSIAKDRFEIGTMGYSSRTKHSHSIYSIKKEDLDE